MRWRWRGGRVELLGGVVKGTANREEPVCTGQISRRCHQRSMQEGIIEYPGVRDQ